MVTRAGLSSVKSMKHPPTSGNALLYLVLLYIILLLYTLSTLSSPLTLSTLSSPLLNFPFHQVIALRCSSDIGPVLPISPEKFRWASVGADKKPCYHQWWIDFMPWKDAFSVFAHFEIVTLVVMEHLVSRCTFHVMSQSSYSDYNLHIYPHVSPCKNIQSLK